MTTFLDDSQMNLRNFKKVLLCGVPFVIPRAYATRTYNMP